jgi:hypothetical protein
LFKQTAGKTIVSSAHFAGISSITNNSILNFIDNAEITATTKLEIWKSTMTIDVNVGNWTFSDDVLKGDGLVLKNNNADLDITGGNSKFTGLFKQSAGTVNVSSSYFAGISSITNGSVINFINNAKIMPTTKLEIWNSTMTIKENAGGLSLGENGLSGNGLVFKNNNDILEIVGDNSKFTGKYNQNLGALKISSNAFNAAHNINAGTVELATGTIFSDGTKFILADISTMNITTNENLEFDGDTIEATNATINKTGTGLLEITGGNENFKGLFTQTAGATTIKS